MSNINLIELFGFIIAGLYVLYLYLIYRRFGQPKSQAGTNSDELAGYHELKTNYARLEAELQYIRQDQERYKGDMLALCKVKEELEHEFKVLDDANRELTTNNNRLQIENDYLKKSQQQLEQVLTNLKHDMGQEFIALRNLAIQ